MAGGAGAVEMMKNTSLSRGELHLTNQAEMSEIAKESCVNYFASVLLGLVRKMANEFFQTNSFR
jgi:hypothetical protein